MACFPAFPPQASWLVVSLAFSDSSVTLVLSAALRLQGLVVLRRSSRGWARPQSLGRDLESWLLPGAAVLLLQACVCRSLSPLVLLGRDEGWAVRVILAQDLSIPSTNQYAIFAFLNMHI